ncbi:hypothetical protein PHET_08270 [Paragonimus heterotremus]|uniref:Uncharacterized protein n=1 Tax=Paragonimus heterotremus TaxID=100268 RepID=A0A8J4T668_9TREM|nr:hypothetical protein PHET_08270 [Paragonimus heterotremus]
MGSLEFARALIPPNTGGHQYSNKFARFTSSVGKRVDIMKILNGLTIFPFVHRCARDIACRSVYYNELRGECFRAMYADSLLAGNLAKVENGWIRFAKTAIPKLNKVS